MSHTLGLTHKLVINGGCSAPSPGQANCLLSHSTPGIDFHSNLHASGGGGAALPPEPIVHSWTTPGVANPPDYLPWSRAWVVYSEATVRYHPHLLPHLCSETFCGAAPGGPWSVVFGRVSRSGSRSGTRPRRHYAAPHPTVGALPPFSRPRRSGPGGLPGTSRGLFLSARRSGSSIAPPPPPPSAPRRGPTAPCAWVWICPRLEEPRYLGIPRYELRYGMPPVDAATSSASALCGPRIGRSCATCGKSGYTSPSGSLVGPALPPSFYSVRGGASLDCRTRSRVQPRPPLPR